MKVVCAGTFRKSSMHHCDTIYQDINMKRSAAVLLCIILFAASFGNTKVHAFTPGLENFIFVRSYDERFADVSENDWFYSPVAFAYRTGLVSGSGPSSFSPGGNVTIAESVAFACRLEKIYNTGWGAFEEGTPWYEVYVRYAADHGIKCSFDDFSRPASRAEFAYIMSSALPSEAFAPLMDLPYGSIYDIPAGSYYEADAYKLYRAGILEGSDDRGGFYPDSFIKRSEAAAVISRIASVDLRSVAKLQYYAREGRLDSGRSYSLSGLPEYAGFPYVFVNGNVPSFDLPSGDVYSWESYGALDELGRCTGASACVGKDLMPSQPRGSIGMVRPTGWQTVRYDGLIDGNYLYNRCHLIAYQLTGENANERNLITGTRYLNINGMQIFEEKVASYVNATGNHVLYRSVPVFAGDELVARGVHLEGLSVEDGGSGLCFNVFLFNVQPGIEIDYKDGTSSKDEGYSPSK